MKKQHGFSLIELLIVIAIIGVLSAVAYPAYQGYVKQGKVTVGKQYVLDLANAEETYRADNLLYVNYTGPNTDSAQPLSVTEPKEIQPYYTTVTVVTNNGGLGYKITAAGLDLPTLTLDNTGARSW